MPMTDKLDWTTITDAGELDATNLPRWWYYRMGKLMIVTVDMTRTATGAVHYTLPNWAAIKSTSGSLRLYGSLAVLNTSYIPIGIASVSASASTDISINVPASLSDVQHLRGQFTYMLD